MKSLYCLWVITSLMSLQFAIAAEYHVTIDGNDDSTGTLTSPFRTLSKALDIVKSNDIIILHGGIYETNTIFIKNVNAVSDSDIVIRNYEDETPVIDFMGAKYGIYLENTSNLKFYGLVFRNVEEGVLILGNSKNIEISRCVFNDIINRGIFSHGKGYEGFPQKVFILDNDFFNIGRDTIGADIALGAYTTQFTIARNRLHGNVDGIVASESSSGHVIENNEIYNHAQEDGIDFKNSYKRTEYEGSDFTQIIGNTIYGHPTQSGITIQFGSMGFIIENNRIFENNTGIWIRSAGTKEITIRSNDIFNNLSRGVTVSDGAEGHIDISANRIYDNGSVSSAIKEAGICLLSGASYIINDNVVSANAMFESYKPQIYLAIDTKSISSSGNTFYLPDNSYRFYVAGTPYTFDDWQQIFGLDINSVLVTGRFDPESVNLVPPVIQLKQID